MDFNWQNNSFVDFSDVSELDQYVNPTKNLTGEERICLDQNLSFEDFNIPALGCFEDLEIVKPDNDVMMDEPKNNNLNTPMMLSPNHGWFELSQRRYDQSIFKDFEKVKPDDDVSMDEPKHVIDRDKAARRKRRHRLDDVEKQTRRKASNRKAAEKYRNKKKREQMSFSEKYEEMSDVVHQLIAAIKSQGNHCKLDAGVIKTIEEAEQLFP